MPAAPRADHPTAFLLGEPYLSEPLARHIRNRGAPAIALDDAGRLQAATHHIPLTTAEDFVEDYRSRRHAPLLLAVSPRAPAWIAEHLAGSALAEQVAVLDDKVAFRRRTAELYPDFRFQPVDPRHPAPPTELPVLVKPAHGSGGVGVRNIEGEGQWHRHLHTLAEDGCQAAIAEQVLEGPEYAADFVLGIDGRLRIVTVLERLAPAESLTFLYRTDPELRDRMGEFIATELLRVADHLHLAPMTGVAEFRTGHDGRLAPVEINPCRFGAWGTADIAPYAYGTDPYQQLTEDVIGNVAHRRDGTRHLVGFVDRPRKPTAGVDYELLAPGTAEVEEIRPVGGESAPFLAALFLRTTTPDAFDRTVETLRRGVPEEALYGQRQGSGS
ncbi:ATP-grasp domain-containing protein [Streptomyces sp. NPDC055808]